MANALCQGKDSNGKTAPMGATTDSTGAPALNAVISAKAGAAQITPEISGVPTAEIQVDVLTTAQIVGAVATVNPGDAVEAATRLSARYPEVQLIGNDETVRFYSNSAITSIYVAFLANIAVVEAAYSAPTATGTIATNTTLADFLTIQVPFEFDSVDAVNMVEVQLIPYSDGTTEKNLGRFKVAGYSL